MVSKEHKSFCRLCTAGCGVVISVEDDTVIEVRGDRTHPISRGYTCVKGRSLGIAHHDPARLDGPLLRRDGALVEVEWDEWFDDLAGRLSSVVKNHGPSAVGVFYSGGSYFDASGHRIREAFISALGTRSIYSSYTLDSPNKPLVAELVGGSVTLSPLPDLHGTTCMLIIATNPVVSHGHGVGIPNPMVELRQVRARGDLWVLDPRRTETAQIATRHLAPRPGTDYAVLAFLVRELLRGGADEHYVRRYVEGVAQLAQAVERFSADSVAGFTGLAAQDLWALLAAIRRAGRVSILTGTGASMSRTANVLEWLAWALGIVTGSLDQPGGTWFNPGFFRQNDKVVRPPAPPDGFISPGPTSRPELYGRNNQLPAVAIPDEIAAKNLRALFAVGANLVAAMPDTRRVVEALRDLEVFVVADVVRNETADLATHVAPCAGQLERSDLSTSSEIYQAAVIGQYTAPVVALGANRKPLWWIMAHVANRIGFDVLPEGLDARSVSTDDILAHIGGAGRLPYHEVHDSEGPLLAEERPVFGWVLDGGILPGGRWRIAPPLLVEQLNHLVDEPASLVLIPRRERRQMNGFLRFLQDNPEPEVIMHPTDAKNLSLKAGDAVNICTDRGEMQAVVLLDKEMSIGVLSVPHAWRGPSSVNNLLSCGLNVDPLTGMPVMSGVPVTISKRLPQ